MEKTNIPVVGAIIEKEENGEKYILIQTRWKPGTEYHDTIETPVGWLREWENIYDGLQREVDEETSLEITHINKQNNIKAEYSHGFTPFYCTQQKSNGLSWLMIGFVCKCKGESRSQEEETRNPRWISIDELENIIKNESIFGLQKSFFEYYLEHYREIEFEEFGSL